MSDNKDRNSDTVPEIPKISRRFSIGGLFHRKNDKTKPALSRTASLSNIPAIEVNSGSNSSLRRTKSLASTIGRLFRRKSVLELQNQKTPQLVSSLYLGDNAARSNVQLEEGGFHQNSGQESLTLDGDQRRSIDSYSKVTETLKENQRRSPVRILTSSRCVLMLESRLVQGTMLLSNMNVTFSSSIVRPRFQILINYSDIVAIIPFGDRTGIKIATQKKCLLLQGYPERDEFLQLMMDEWVSHCRRFLLAQRYNLQDRPASSCAWLRKSQDPTTETTAVLRRAKSINRDLLSVPKPTSIYSCGCMRHYKTDIVELELKSTPLAVAGVLFGLGGSGVSYAGTYFAARGGTTIEETSWVVNDNDDVRERMVIAHVPDAFCQTSMMRVEIIQRITKETADIITMESRLLLKRTSFGSNYQCMIRWCIVRENLEEKSKIRVTAEVGTVGPVPLPIQTVEEKLVTFMKKNFVAMLETLKVRFDVAARKEQSFDDIRPGLLRKMINFSREAIFLEIYPLKEWIEEYWDTQLISYHEIVVITLIIMFIILLLRWSLYQPNLVPPIAVSSGYKFIEKDDLLKNVTDTMTFIRNRAM